MGFNLEKAKQRTAEKPSGFIPVDLNEGNVRALFNRCLKSADTKEIRYTTLIKKDLGYEETETPVDFDKDKIQANEKTIRYLFGQVEVVHKGLFSLTEDESTIKYDGSKWTANSGLRGMLLLLAAGARIMSPFVAEVQKAGLIKLAPTLSPKDPKFAAWWEAHKAEWET